MLKNGTQIVPLLDSPTGKDAASRDDATKPLTAAANETTEEKSEPANTGSAGVIVSTENNKEVSYLKNLCV